MSTRRTSPAVLVAILVAHVGVTSLTWRDLRRRGADQVRGSKKAWRLASAVNTLGSVAYVVFGRRSGR